MSKNKKKLILVEPRAIREPISHYAEDFVRFSLYHCAIGDDYCISKLSYAELERLYKTLGHFENCTWRQFDMMTRAKAFTPELEHSSSHSLLRNIKPFLKGFGHFRVDGTDHPFRVFAARTNNLIYLMLFDREGKIHHG